MLYDRLWQVYIGLIRDRQLNWRGEAEPGTVPEHEVNGQQGAQDETKKPHLYSRHEADSPRRYRVLDPDNLLFLSRRLRNARIPQKTLQPLKQNSAAEQPDQHAALRRSNCHGGGCPTQGLEHAPRRWIQIIIE